jgi:hypothetical protein
MVFDRDEFEMRIKDKESFMLEVMEGRKIILKGTLDVV